MTCDELKYVYKVLRSYRINKFSKKTASKRRNARLQNPKESIILKRRIGGGKFCIEIDHNDIVLEIEKYWYNEFVLVLNNSTNSFALLLNRELNNDHTAEAKVYRIENLSDALEEDGYFQQSLVQKLPLEYNDLIKIIAEVEVIKKKVFDMYDIDAQNQRDVK